MISKLPNLWTIIIKTFCLWVLPHFFIWTIMFTHIPLVQLHHQITVLTSAGQTVVNVQFNIMDPKYGVVFLIMLKELLNVFLKNRTKILSFLRTDSNVSVKCYQNYLAFCVSSFFFILHLLVLNLLLIYFFVSMSNMHTTSVSENFFPVRWVRGGVEKF